MGGGETEWFTPRSMIRIVSNSPESAIAADSGRVD
jgi:hypothetical protein